MDREYEECKQRKKVREQAAEKLRSMLKPLPKTCSKDSNWAMIVRGPKR